MKEHLTIVEERTENTLSLYLKGEVNSNTVGNLERYLGSNLDNIEKLVFELENLRFISSAGLRILLGAAKIMDKKQGNMIVRNPQPSVQQVFDITGFSGILTIESDNKKKEI